MSLYLGSFIVPVYNAERWLRECIDSVLGQTCREFELLLIDDGSTDSSLSICNEYAAKDSRIRVISKSNSGVSSARNMGLELASGEFLLFLDSDDLLHPQMLELLKSADDLHHADCYCWNYRTFSDQCSFNSLSTVPFEIYSREEMLKRTLALESNMMGYVWNKAFRRSCMSAQFHTDIAIQEDLLFVCECIANMSSDWVHICASLNGYRKHSASISAQPFSHRELTLLTARDHIIEALEHSDLRETPEVCWLKEDLPRHACIMNKKLLLSAFRSSKNSQKLIDEVWRKYRTFSHPGRWSLKEKAYYFIQTLCYAFRAQR
ncbi:MAG: glycosyltransferase family 2 protein [Clostridia bacterium]|nr:glycosyltransferase family 2 protein [Clostridia bacterium]